LSVPQSELWLDAHLGIRQMTFVLVGASRRTPFLDKGSAKLGRTRLPPSSRMMVLFALMRRKLPRSDGNHLCHRCHQLHAGGTRERLGVKVMTGVKDSTGVHCAPLPIGDAVGELETNY
jgi:hypothetical protein